MTWQERFLEKEHQYDFRGRVITEFLHFLKNSRTSAKIKREISTVEKAIGISTGRDFPIEAFNKKQAVGK